MNGYKTQFLNTQPIDGDGADNKVIVVVFTDLSADRAKGLFGDVLKQVAAPSYEKDGILFGPFYEGNEGPRSTTRTSGHFNRRCRFSSLGKESSATGSSSWTTMSGSNFGRIATENPEPRLSLRNSAACRGARSATNPTTNKSGASAFGLLPLTSISRFCLFISTFLLFPECRL
jgi:hypothetical protein